VLCLPDYYIRCLCLGRFGSRRGDFYLAWPPGIRRGIPRWLRAFWYRRKECAGGPHLAAVVRGTADMGRRTSSFQKPQRKDCPVLNSEVPRTVFAWNNAQVPNLGTDCAVPCPGPGPSPPAAGGAVSRDTILPQPRAGVEGAWDCGRDLWATFVTRRRGSSA
jgi:hypothetical protein